MSKFTVPQGYIGVRSRVVQDTHRDAGFAKVHIGLARDGQRRAPQIRCQSGVLSGIQLRSSSRTTIFCFAKACGVAEPVSKQANRTSSSICRTKSSAPCRPPSFHAISIGRAIPPAVAPSAILFAMSKTGMNAACRNYFESKANQLCNGRAGWNTPVPI